MTAAGQTVQYVHDASLVNGCNRLGHVHSNVTMGGGFGGSLGANDDAQKNNRNEFKNKAAEMGGTHILIDEGPGNMSVPHDADVFKCVSDTK